MKGIKGFQKGNKEWQKVKNHKGHRFSKGHKTNIGRKYCSERNQKLYIPPPLRNIYASVLGGGLASKSAPLRALFYWLAFGLKNSVG